MNDSPDMIAPQQPGRLAALRARVNVTMLVEVSWLAAGFASKFLIQMGTLYYLTRTLDLAGMGMFYSLIGLFACLLPFVQLGNYDLTIRQIARGEDPRTVAGRAMRSSAVLFFAALPVLLLLRMFFAPEIAWPAYLAVAAGELLVMRVMSNVQAVATGFRLHYVCATSDFLLGVSRFVAIYAAFRLHAGIATVLTLYAFTSMPAAIAACAWMVRRIGWPTLRGGPLFADFGEHLRMVVAWFAEMAAREGDKPLLKAFADSTATGVYGTATRLLSVAIVPIDLVTQVLRPRVGRACVEGDAAGRRLCRQMTVALGAIGAIVGLCLFGGAVALPHVAPHLIPAALDPVRVALMYLAIVPPIYGLQRANVIAAISRGATGAYATATATAAVVGLGTLAALAPRLGWRGAIVASVVYLSTSCTMTWLLVRAADRRPADRKAFDPAAADAEGAAVAELELQAAV